MHVEFSDTAVQRPCTENILAEVRWCICTRDEVFCIFLPVSLQPVCFLLPSLFPRLRFFRLLLFFPGLFNGAQLSRCHPDGCLRCCYRIRSGSPCALVPLIQQTIPCACTKGDRSSSRSDSELLCASLARSPRVTFNLSPLSSAYIILHDSAVCSSAHHASMSCRPLLLRSYDILQFLSLRLGASVCSKALFCKLQRSLRSCCCTYLH